MVGRARLEKAGPPFLRSICKLAYSGLGRYEKGDGLDIKLWLEETYPDVVHKSIGRVELSKRQDWVMEVSSKIFPIMGKLHEYLVNRVPDGPNVLRDSTLQRIEEQHPLRKRSDTGNSRFVAPMLKYFFSSYNFHHTQ